ncbi:hypothetical protein Scep_019967 [Stephania cephalantha]|uniref:Uncharacterized protein n=1 Tax=Stephania cephalantha TaxID=152367 RepID=A0AAP0NMP5_9MAGN
MKIDEPLLQSRTNLSKVSNILHVGESSGDNRPAPTPPLEPPDLVVLRVDSTNVALARPPWPPLRLRSSLMSAFLLRVHEVFVDQDLVSFRKVGARGRLFGFIYRDDWCDPFYTARDENWDLRIFYS